MILDEDIYLEHWGIKGMRWGVRNEKGKKTYFGMTKKQAAVGASVLVGLVAAGLMAKDYTTLSSGEMNQAFAESSLVSGRKRAEEVLSKHGGSKDVIFPKGHEFHRTTQTASTLIRQGTYVADEPKDIAFYESVFGGKTKHKKVYEAESDVKTPSLKTRLDAMAEIVDKPVPGVTKDGKTYREYLADQQKSHKAKLYVKKISSKKLGEEVYGGRVGGHWDKGIGKAFSDELVRKGYGAMLDDADSTNGIADHPMILLDRRVFRMTHNKPMTKDEIDDSWNAFNKLLVK